MATVGRKPAVQPLRRQTSKLHPRPDSITTLRYIRAASKQSAEIFGADPIIVRAGGGRRVITGQPTDWQPLYYSESAQRFAVFHTMRYKLFMMVVSPL